MNKQELLSYLKEAQTHLSEIEKHTIANYKHNFPINK